MKRTIWNAICHMKCWKKNLASLFCNLLPSTSHAVKFFLLFFNFSYHMATFVKWIVYKNEKCKIVSPPISSWEGYISGRLCQKLRGSIKNLHVEVTYNVQGDRGQKTYWAYFVIAVLSTLSTESQICEWVPKIWPMQFSGVLYI